jgi:hypothetical protein
MLTNEDTIEGAYDNVRTTGKLKAAMSFEGTHGLIDRKTDADDVTPVMRT